MGEGVILEKKPPAVLYVEDDTQSRRLMKMLLTGRMKLPHVTIFEDSTDFLSRVNALDPKPDLIFLDIHMLPITGFEMLKMLRDQEWSRTIPVVALTASVMNEEVQTLRTAGFNSCLAKPIDLATFPDTFERILAGEALWRIID
jgi:two-component system, cell cycle response regulator DivK